MQLPEAMIGQKGECPGCREVIVPVPVLDSLTQGDSLSSQPEPVAPSVQPEREPAPTPAVEKSTASEEETLKLGATTFTEENLTEGETILHAGRFHPIHIWLVNINFVVLIWIRLIYLEHEYNAAISLPVLLWVSPYFLGWFFFWCAARNRVYKTEFVLTNKRLLTKCGFLFTDCREIRLEKIESVYYGQIFLERWLGIGRLTVRGTGGGRVGKFPYLADALEFRRRILAQIDRVKT